MLRPRLTGNRIVEYTFRMAGLPVLLVEDDPDVSDSVGRILTSEGYDVLAVGSGEDAERSLRTRPANVVILDVGLPDADGRDLLARWHQEHPETQIVMLTGNRGIATAVSCIKAGACDFLVKPVGRALLVKAVEGAARELRLTRQVNVLTQLATREDAARRAGIVAESPAMRRVMDMAQRVAASDYSCVLLCGETGVGKGMLARALHKMSPRGENPLVELNCSAMPATLVESELFGHQKGAFTDARESRAGVFEMADGGALFLDEIGDMDVSLQAKLLKVIEEQHFRRIGGSVEVTVSVALIAATNQDIPQRVAEGKFRSDLFYRLNVVPLVIPPLRDRAEDLAPLAAYFRELYARKFGKRITCFSDEATAALHAYAWPGNVRELRNVVERACLLVRREVIEPADLLLAATPAGGGTAAPAGVPMTLARAEELAIRAALEAAKGNRNTAAATLAVHRSTLYKKLREYGIDGEVAPDDGDVRKRVTPRVIG